MAPVLPTIAMRIDQSLANPWLDFLPSTRDTTNITIALNNDLQSICSQHPKSLYAFGVLPSTTCSASTWITTIHYISRLSYIKGVILGTKGLGRGLDDPGFDEIWATLENHKLMVFIHPHYGVGKDVYGQLENGHVLPLALGFPFETTIVASLKFILTKGH